MIISSFYSLINSYSVIFMAEVRPVTNVMAPVILMSVFPVFLPLSAGFLPAFFSPLISLSIKRKFSIMKQYFCRISVTIVKED